MRTIFAMLAALAISFGTYAQNDAAIAYNDNVVTEQNRISEALISLMGLMDGGTNDQIEASYQELLGAIDLSIANLEKIGGFEGDQSVYKAGHSLFLFYKEVMGKDYRELLNIYMMEAPTEADIARLDAIVTEVSTREVAYDEAFSAAQTAFAAKYGFELAPNEFEDDFDEMEDY